MVDLFAELTSLTRALDDAGVPYALCGGVALAIHGVARATKDIDLLILPTDVERACESARSRGFVFESHPIRFKKTGVEMKRVSKLVGDQPLMLDMLLATGAALEPFNARIRVPFEAGELSVVTRAGLIALKLAAGRPQDLADVARLEAPDDEDIEL